MQTSGFQQVLFAIISAAKIDMDNQDCGGNSASQRRPHQHPENQCLLLSPWKGGWPRWATIKQLQAGCAVSFHSRLFLPSWWAHLYAAIWLRLP